MERWSPRSRRRLRAIVRSISPFDGLQLLERRAPARRLREDDAVLRGDRDLPRVDRRHGARVVATRALVQRDLVERLPRAISRRAGSRRHRAAAARTGRATRARDRSSRRVEVVPRGVHLLRSPGRAASPSRTAADGPGRSAGSPARARCATHRGGPERRAPRVAVRRSSSPAPGPTPSSGTVRSTPRTTRVRTPCSSPRSAPSLVAAIDSRETRTRADEGTRTLDLRHGKATL